MENKRPIIIQGAMEAEIDYLKETIQNIEEIEIDGYKFYKGEIDNYPIVISKTNIGLIEAGISTYIGIKNFKPLAVINQGTAGALSKNVHKYDIVIGTECININSYITEYKKENEGSNSLSWRLLTFKEGIDEFVTLKAESNLCDIANIACTKYDKGNVIKGVLGSGDVWNKEIDRINWFSSTYGVLCEDMESISVYKVCEKFNVPVLGIRVISDNELLGEVYEKKAAKELQKFAIEVARNLVNKE